MRHRRRFPRKRSSKRARIIWDPAREPQRCTIQDISFEGARLRVDADSEIPPSFCIYVSADDVMYEAELRWRRGRDLGVRFARPGIVVGSWYLDMPAPNENAVTQTWLLD